MSDTSRFKCPVWLRLCEWPSRFASKVYSLVPLLRFCTNATRAPSPVPEVEQGLGTKPKTAQETLWELLQHVEGARQSGATWGSAPTSPRTEGIAWRSDPSRSLGVLSVPPSSWEQALANAHPRQHGDLCISVGIAGTACLCCWSRKESALAPAQSTHRESRSSSGHPTG